MAKRTTVKAVALGYRDVGTSGDYTPLMGVLKGLAVAQDEPDSTEIEAEFYDSPFDIFYDGNPVTMTFELANYDLGELEDLFGGAYDDTNDEYEAASNAFTSEHEWKLDFGRGNASLVIYKGLTIGTLKKDADGALNYSVTITALIYNDGESDHMYKIVGSSGDTPTPTPTPAESFEISIGNPTSRQMQVDDTITFTNGFVASDFVGHLGFEVENFRFLLQYNPSNQMFWFFSESLDQTRGAFAGEGTEEPFTKINFQQDADGGIPSGSTFEYYE